MGSEMCIRDRACPIGIGDTVVVARDRVAVLAVRSGIARRARTRCLLYTSDAADERSSVDLGGRRIIKKKNRRTLRWRVPMIQN